jgi:hypothetical protein
MLMLIKSFEKMDSLRLKKPPQELIWDPWLEIRFTLYSKLTRKILY